MFSEASLMEMLPLIHDTTTQGSFPLHFAALRKDVRYVRRLIQLGVAVNSVNFYLETPLHWAVKAGHADVVRVLLEAGACVHMEDADSHSPSDWAIEEGQSHLLAFLRPPSRPTTCRSTPNCT